MYTQRQINLAFLKPALIFYALIWALALPAAVHAQPRNRALGENSISESVVSRFRVAHEALSEWQVKKARKIIDELLADNPDSAPLIFFSGKVAFFEGDYARAMDILNKRLESAEIPREAKAFIDFVAKIYETAKHFAQKESDHFVFRYVKGKDEILARYGLGALEAAYREIGKDLQYHPDSKVIVEVFPSADSFCSASTLTKEEIESSGTIAICKWNRLIITTPRALLRGYSWLDTLAHEYVHYLIMKKSQNSIPVWLHEGIAKFEQSRWREEKGGSMSPTSRSVVAEAIENDYFIAFEQMHPSMAKLKHTDNMLAFAEVEIAVEYILSRGGYPAIVKVLDEAAKGQNVEKAIESALGRSFEEFNKKWMSYLKSKRFKKIPGIEIMKPHLKDPDAEESKEAELKQIEKDGARKFAFLGDLLRDRNRLAAAIIEYRKAKDAAGTLSPIIFNKLGLALMLGRQYKEAEKVLTEVVSYYPGYVTSYSNLGSLYLQNEQYDKAITNLTAAIGINPFDPATHRGLIIAYQKLGKEKKAEEQMKDLTILVAAAVGKQ